MGFGDHQDSIPRMEELSQHSETGVEIPGGDIMSTGEHDRSVHLRIPLVDSPWANTLVLPLLRTDPIGSDRHGSGIAISAVVGTTGATVYGMG